MTLTVSLIWIVGMAIATIAILTVGTLAAADLLPRPGSRSADEPAQTVAQRSATPASAHDIHDA